VLEETVLLLCLSEWLIGRRLAALTVLHGDTAGVIDTPWIADSTIQWCLYQGS
jgi:hypothetical protein